jgi:hypothetical protein
MAIIYLQILTDWFGEDKKKCVYCAVQTEFLIAIHNFQSKNLKLYFLIMCIIKNQNSAALV